jgi:hypothetical protein
MPREGSRSEQTARSPPRCPLPRCGPRGTPERTFRGRGAYDKDKGFSISQDPPALPRVAATTTLPDTKSFSCKR